MHIKMIKLQLLSKLATTTLKRRIALRISSAFLRRDSLKRKSYWNCIKKKKNNQKRGKPGWMEFVRVCGGRRPSPAAFSGELKVQ